MGKNLEPRKCKNCPRTFEPKREHAQFCSDDCRHDFHRNGKMSRRKIEDVYKRTAGHDVADLRKTVAALAARLDELERRIK
jgi:protein-arginine kinase activator protein McsA